MASWPETRVEFDRFDLDRVEAAAPQGSIERPRDGAVDILIASWTYGGRQWFATQEDLLSGVIGSEKSRRFTDCWGSTGCTARVNPANPRQLDVNTRWNWKDSATLALVLSLAAAFLVAGWKMWRRNLKKVQETAPLETSAI
jgi:hypothetical protein